MFRPFVLAIFISALAIASIGAQSQGPGTTCITPRGEPGTCVGIRECPSLLKLLQAPPLRRETVDFLRESQCSGSSESNTNPLVCCKSDNSRTDAQEDNADVNMRVDISNNPLLPRDCGRDLSQRIVGGEQTEIDEFPWVALMEYQTPFGTVTACGGTLISDRYVLTAAHCINGKSIPATWSLNSVRLGEYNTDTNPDCIRDGDDELCADEPLSIRVQERIVHERYLPQSPDQIYDIGLLRLATPVTFTTFVKPICLPTNSSLGQRLFVSGWGQTETGYSSKTKLKLALPPSDKTQCAKIYRNYGVNLGFGQICAGGVKGKDSCHGDSGGPLMTVESSNSGSMRWTCVGVVSFGPTPCGSENWPGVYTRVIDYMPWILRNIKP